MLDRPGWRLGEVRLSPSHNAQLYESQYHAIRNGERSRALAARWAHRKVLIKCDNAAVVKVLTSSKTKDAFLGVCARNVWQVASLHDIEFSYVHIPGKYNVVADLLSRWTGSEADICKLHSHIPDPLWLVLNHNVLDVDCEI